MIAYHGTNVDVPKFDPKWLGYGTFHPSARLGFFFSPTREGASPFGRKILTVRLNFKNHRDLTEDEWHRATNSVADAKKLREELIAAGHDGVTNHMGEIISLTPEPIEMVNDHERMSRRRLSRRRSISDYDKRS